MPNVHILPVRHLTGTGAKRLAEQLMQVWTSVRACHTSVRRFRFTAIWLGSCA